MEMLLRVGLSNAACAAGLAALAWVASQLFRRPAVSHALWVLVLLKFVTPPIWTVPISLPAAAPKEHDIGASHHSAPVTQTSVALENVSSDSHASLPTSNQFARIQSLAGGLWLAGTIACALLTLLRLRRFSRILTYGVLAPPAVQCQAVSIGELLGLRTVPEVWLLPGPVCPMLWAAFGRSRILLPGGLWDRMTRGQQASILAHELAHLRRRDHWVRLLELVVTPLYWWNPILWWTRRELHIAEESCCDAWVAWALPGISDDYASALIESIEFASPRPTITGVASGVGRLWTLKRRLLMIQHGNSRRGLGITGTFAVCMASLLLPFVPGLSQTAGQSADRQSTGSKSVASQPTSQPVESAPNRELIKKLSGRLPDLTFQQVAWADVMNRIHDLTGIQFEIDWKTLESVGIRGETPITIRLQNLAVHTALLRIIGTVAPKRTVVWRFNDGAVALTIAPKPVAMQERMKRMVPAMRFDHVSFRDVIDFLRDVSGQNIVVDWKTIEAAGIDPDVPVTADMKDVPFTDALAAVLASAGGQRAKLGYRIDQDVIAISTVEQLPKQLVVQVYKISDFSVGSTQLIETIIDSIDPHSWKLRGGTTGDIREEKGQLVVTQTPVNQHAIALLLENLRQLMKSGTAK
jgi:beta-lactamase regulating signal transducer with metallopeptidase domain